MAHLVRRLLELSHPGDEAVTPIDPNEVAEDAIRLISVRSPRSRARIRTELAGDLAPVETNPDRLRQVLLNLLDNALDAIGDNDGEVVLRTRAKNGMPVIEVEDSGEGISEENLLRVFDPFFTTKDVGKGTGLGLYVSYEIMKNLGGDIAITSRPDDGTCVRLTLPPRVDTTLSIAT
ncbi:MAG: ATP-binding protein [Planctomycetes bacterium]|nr:ATP-binding protein [Planctomycetota bacterium]